MKMSRLSRAKRDVQASILDKNSLMMLASELHLHETKIAILYYNGGNQEEIRIALDDWWRSISHLPSDAVGAEVVELLRAYNNSEGMGEKDNTLHYAKDNHNDNSIIPINLLCKHLTSYALNELEQNSTTTDNNNAFYYPTKVLLSAGISYDDLFDSFINSGFAGSLENLFAVCDLWYQDITANNIEDQGIIDSLCDCFEEMVNTRCKNQLLSVGWQGKLQEFRMALEEL